MSLRSSFLIALIVTGGLTSLFVASSSSEADAATACRDGTVSKSRGRGTCSHHGGVATGSSGTPVDPGPPQVSPPTTFRPQCATCYGGELYYCRSRDAPSFWHFGATCAGERLATMEYYTVEEYQEWVARERERLARSSTAPPPQVAQSPTRASAQKLTPSTRGLARRPPGRSGVSLPPTTSRAGVTTMVTSPAVATTTSTITTTTTSTTSTSTTAVPERGRVVPVLATQPEVSVPPPLPPQACEPTSAQTLPAGFVNPSGWPSRCSRTR